MFESDVWLDLHEKFKLLAIEEVATSQAKSEDRRLRGYCTYREHPEIIGERGKPEQGPFCLLHTPECGLWLLDEGPSENFRARFEALATRAGVKLGPPQGVDCLDFWLHRLYLDLRENNSSLLFAADDTGGMILDVPEASSIFARTGAVKGKSRPVSPVKIRRVAGRNNLKILIRYTCERHPDWTVRQIAGQIDDHFSKRGDPVPIPQSWKVAGCASLVEAYDNAITRNRVKKFFSVVTRVT